MTFQEADIYWWPARAKLPGLIHGAGQGVEYSNKLCILLGIEPIFVKDELTIHKLKLTEDLKAKLLAIQGPYSHAIIKAIEARKVHD